MFQKVSPLSRAHGTLCLGSETVSYFDHSTNGTWINGQRVSFQTVLLASALNRLMPGDREILIQRERLPDAGQDAFKVQIELVTGKWAFDLAAPEQAMTGNRFQFSERHLYHSTRFGWMPVPNQSFLLLRTNG